MPKSPTQTLLIASVLTLAGLGFTSMDAEAAPRGGGAAQHERGGESHKAGGKARAIVRASKQLDLNGDQQSTVDKVAAEMRAARDARKGQRGEQRERRERLDGILDGSVTEAQVHARIDQKAARKTARAHQDAEWTFEVLNVLSGDQKQQLRTIMEERRANRGSGGQAGPAGAQGKGKRSGGPGGRR